MAAALPDSGLCRRERPEHPQRSWLLVLLVSGCSVGPRLRTMQPMSQAACVHTWYPRSGEGLTWPRPPASLSLPRCLCVHVYSFLLFIYFLPLPPLSSSLLLFGLRVLRFLLPSQSQRPPQPGAALCPVSASQLSHQHRHSAGPRHHRLWAPVSLRCVPPMRPSEGEASNHTLGCPWATALWRGRHGAHLAAGESAGHRPSPGALGHAARKGEAL